MLCAVWLRPGRNLIYVNDSPPPAMCAGCGVMFLPHIIMVAVRQSPLTQIEKGRCACVQVIFTQTFRFYCELSLLLYFMASRRVLWKRTSPN